MKFIKNILLIVLVFFALMSISVYAIQKLVTNHDLATNTFQLPISINADYLTSLVNDWRIKNGLQAFTKDADLCAYADKRSVEIQTDFSHTKFLSSPCNVKQCGENLAKGLSTENVVLQDWVNSPEHLANLKYSYSSMCISCKGNYCAQEFRTSTYIPTPTPDNSEFIRVRAIALSNCVGSAGAGYVHNIQVAQQNQQDTPENLTMMYNLEQSEINDCYRVTGVTRTNF